jgi:predicted O-methyltransferase YrrM
MSQSGNRDFDEAQEITDLLRLLREKLKAWNSQHGHPFDGISDGYRTPLNSELMPACRAFADRLDLIATLPKGGVFAEIGNFFGDFTVKILELNAPRELHTFDWNLQNIRPENRLKLDASEKVHYYDGDPHITFLEVPSSTFDIIYLNKAKDFVSVTAELDMCMYRLKPDGFLVVNDFTSWDPVQGFPYGVLPAVSQFANQHRLEIAYVALHARGFLNVALRRMD